MGAAYDRARGHEVHPNEDGTFSGAREEGNVWFTVDLEGLTCTCTYFVRWWGNKDTATRIKNMTECSHIAAAARHTGRTDVPWNRYL